MKSTEVLSSEHRVIEQVLNCLERIAERCENQGVLDAEAARKAVAFFRAFADRCHHGKEESCLFPVLESKGFSPSSGPTAVMRIEHDQGRTFVRGMESAMAGAAAGEKRGLELFVKNARGYIELLRSHIEKEDHCLFTMANLALTDYDQRQLLAKFQHVERDELGEGTHESFLQIADELADAYGVLKAESGRPGGVVHCCGH